MIVLFHSKFKKKKPKKTPTTLVTFHNRNVTTLYLYKLNAHSHDLSPLGRGSKYLTRGSPSLFVLSLSHHSQYSQISWVPLTSLPTHYVMKFATKWGPHEHPGPVLYSHTPAAVDWRLGSSGQVLPALLAKPPAALLHRGCHILINTCNVLDSSPQRWEAELSVPSGLGLCIDSAFWIDCIQLVLVYWFKRVSLFLSELKCIVNWMKK